MLHSRHAWFLTGRNVPKSIRAGMRLPVTSFLIALTAFVLGIWGSVWSDRIRDATLLIGRFDASLDVWTTGFYVGALLWALLFYAKMVAEADEPRVIERVALRMPNPRALNIYRVVFYDVRDVLEALDENSTDEDLVDGLQKVLFQIALFSRTFADGDSGVRYGANVMLIHTPDLLIASPSVLAAMRFLPAHMTGMSPVELQPSLQAVLYLPKVLSAESVGSEGEAPPMSEQKAISIALPILRSTPGDRPGAEGEDEQLLPGAPYAVVTGVLSVHEDARSIEADCLQFSADVRRDVVKYFSPMGDGSHIRSFASIRIGSRSNPIGVLNIDSGSPRLLGEEPRYYETFQALMSPILSMMKRPLDVLADRLVLQEPELQPGSPD